MQTLILDCTQLNTITNQLVNQELMNQSIDTSNPWNLSIVNCNNVTIENNCFKDQSNLKGTILLEGVNKLGDFCFSNTGIEIIILPQNNTIQLGKSCFQCCYTLYDIQNTKNIQNVGPYCFELCSELVGDSNNGDYAIDLRGIDYIPQNCFQDCHKIEKVILSHLIEDIKEFAFTGCTQLHTVANLNYCKHIYNEAFRECNSLNNSVGYECGCFYIDHCLAIGENAFKDCISLTKICFSNELETIGNSAFYGCTSLTNLFGLDNLTQCTDIGEYSFYYCPITNLVIKNKGNQKLEIKPFAFYSDIESIHILCLEGNENGYIEIDDDSIVIESNYYTEISYCILHSTSFCLNGGGEKILIQINPKTCKLLELTELRTYKLFFNFSGYTIITSTDIHESFKAGYLTNDLKIWIDSNVEIGEKAFYFNSPISIDGFENLGLCSKINKYGFYNIHFNNYLFNLYISTPIICDYAICGLQDNVENIVFENHLGGNIKIGENAFAGASLYNIYGIENVSEMDGCAFNNITFKDSNFYLRLKPTNKIINNTIYAVPYIIDLFDIENVTPDITKIETNILLYQGESFYVLLKPQCTIYANAFYRKEYFTGKLRLKFKNLNYCQYIYNYAFCNIEFNLEDENNVLWIDNVVEFHEGAFCNTTGYDTVVLPLSTRSIPSRCFYKERQLDDDPYIKFYNLNLYTGVGSEAFYNRKIYTNNHPDFKNEKLLYFDHMDTISDYAFYNTKGYTQLILSPNGTYVGAYSFDYTDMDKYVIYSQYIKKCFDLSFGEYRPYSIMFDSQCQMVPVGDPTQYEYRIDDTIQLNWNSTLRDTYYNYSIKWTEECGYLSSVVLSIKLSSVDYDGNYGPFVLTKEMGLSTYQPLHIINWDEIFELDDYCLDNAYTTLMWIGTTIPLYNCCVFGECCLRNTILCGSMGTNIIWLYNKNDFPVKCSIKSGAFYRCIIGNITGVDFLTFEECENHHYGAFQDSPIQYFMIKIPVDGMSLDNKYYTREELAKIIGLCYNGYIAFYISGNYIPSYTFAECGNLNNLILLNDSEKDVIFCAAAFRNCYNITHFYNSHRILLQCDSLHLLIKEDGIFYNCGSLIKIYAHNLECIQAGTFYNCVSLEKCTLNNYYKEGFNSELGEIELYEALFYNCNSLQTITKEDYILYIKYISDEVFYCCYNLNFDNVDLSLCEWIGKGAFDNCYLFNKSNLILDNLTHIDEYAFSYCTSLNPQTVSMSKIQVLPKGCFCGCEKFNPNQIIFNHGEEYLIEGRCFYNCQSLIGNQFDFTKFYKVNEYTFFNCISFNPDDFNLCNCDTIYKYAFAFCKTLQGKNIDLTSVNNIYEYAFYNCESLTCDLYLPNCNYIGEAAFIGTKIKKVYLNNQAYEKYSKDPTQYFPSDCELIKCYYVDVKCNISDTANPYGSGHYIPYSNAEIGLTGINPKYYLESWKSSTGTTYGNDNPLTIQVNNDLETYTANLKHIYECWIPVKQDEPTPVYNIYGPVLEWDETIKGYKEICPKTVEPSKLYFTKDDNSWNYDYSSLEVVKVSGTESDTNLNIPGYFNLQRSNRVITPITGGSWMVTITNVDTQEYETKIIDNYQYDSEKEMMYWGNLNFEYVSWEYNDTQRRYIRKVVVYEPNRINLLTCYLDVYNNSVVLGDETVLDGPAMGSETSNSYIISILHQS